MGVLILGSPASVGVITAPARLIRTANDVARLQPGEIAVVAASAPRLTQLLASAGALVCEAGGPLSNLATAAREAHIPAVVGASRATWAVADGDTLTVDGGSGMVLLHEREHLRTQPAREFAATC
jgi:phosphohistidine swiveling domain-containing protein